MKKLIYSLTLLSAVLCSSKLFSQALTAGNIVVVRLGDSISTLSSTSVPIVIQQYTTAGVLVNSNYLPSSGTNAVSLAGSATSEGHITLSTNQAAVTLFAYKANAGTTTIAATTAATANRQIVSINASGTVSYPALTSTNFSAGNPRSVVSNGNVYWAAGSNTGVCWGSGSSNIDTIVSNTGVNLRVINIFGGQLYYSTASGTVGIWRVGSGTPTNSGNTSTLYFNATSGTSSSPYGFALNNDSNICYIADDRTIANGGGIQKWKRNGSVWSLVYTLATGSGSTVGARSLVVNWNTSNPTIIATTTESNANRVIKITDSSSTAPAVTLVTAPTNTVFRGVTYTPGTSPLPVKITSFTATNLTNEVLLNWSTASEINNAHFEIERSIDNKNFETIGMVKGQGNSNTLFNYSFTDVSLNVKSSKIYYRLKQVDYDGNAGYSETVSISNTVSKNVGNPVPNPFSNELTVHLNAASPSTATIELVDMLGKSHYSGVELLSAGDNNIHVNTQQLNKGIYFVRVNINGEITTQKIIKN